MKAYKFTTGVLIILMLCLNQDVFTQLGVYKAGFGAGFNNTSGDFNTFIGDSAGYTNTTGLYNTFIGYRAGYSLSFPTFTQSDNTIIGAEAMGGTPFSTSSTDNVIIGKMAGYNHYGSDVVLIGNHAGYFNENGADNVFIGEEAGYLNTEGDDNVFVGEDAGYNNTTANDNTFVGNQAGKTNTTGYRNAFFGNEAGWDNTTGFRNTFVGDSAGVDVGEGYYNTFIGQATGVSTEYADFNTFVGSLSGAENNRTNETNNANYNTYLGYRTGYTNREGQYNVLLGALTDFSSTAMSGNGATNSYNIGIGFDALINGERVYSCVIGSNARVSSDNSCVIGGTTSVTRMSVGIGTDTPDQDASLELAENNKGFLISRMTSAERTTFTSALAVSDEGMMLYNTTSDQINVWDGSQWLSCGVQTLGLSGNTLSISSSNSVDLSGYLDNTDAQDLSLSGNILSLTNDGTTVNLSGYLDNTDAQDLTLTGNTLALSNDVSTVDLSGYLDNTDAQDLTLSGNTLTLTNDASTVDLTAYLDNTDAQNLAFDGSNLTISNGNAVDISSLSDGFEANTDEQDLSLSGNILSLTNDASTIDLTSYLDNTDEQNLAFDGSNLIISNGNAVDISSLRDGFEANTDNQDLSLAGDILSLTNDASTVDLAIYLDNTDMQDLAFDGSILSITNGNSVDLSSLSGGSGSNTDEQELSFDGSVLSITNGNSVNLNPLQDGFEANTDEQELSFDGLVLSISNGNSVNLNPLQDGFEANTDEQDLQDAQLNGSVLQIGIENGASALVDLAPLLNDVYSSISELEHRVTQLEADVAFLLTQTTGSIIAEEDTGVDLYQNIPNPSSNSTRIQYYVPHDIGNVSLAVYDMNGKMHEDIEITNKGLNYIDLDITDLQAGNYFYSLLVDGKLAITKKMLVSE